MNTCANCVHFNAFYPPTHGECHRYPPTPFKDGTTEVPRIKANRRQCGEFVALPEGAVAEPQVKANVPSHGLVTKKDKKPGKTVTATQSQPTTALVTQ